jgi:hypothetical protein
MSAKSFSDPTFRDSSFLAFFTRANQPASNELARRPTYS